MTFYVDEEQKLTLPVDIKEHFQRVAEAVLNAEGCPYEAEINLLIVDDETIREMNRTARDIDRATDVLSFPMVQYAHPSDFSELEEGEADAFNPETGELMLGDIVISADRVLAQAAEYGHSVLREFSFLIVHSVLHLIGYDHISVDESEVMESKQKAILSALKIER
jgi:probable rRNA maturation factor